MWVSNAKTQTHINGEYALVINYVCNGLNFWMQQDTEPINYLYYSDLTINNQTVVLEGWRIGFDVATCSAIASVWAKTYGYYEYPDQVPEGTWMEYVNASTTYVTNEDMTVVCDGSLSSAAIAGIVIVSICCATIILSVIGAVVVKYKQHKREAARLAMRTQNPDSSQAEFAVDGGYANPQVPATICLPPPYDSIDHPPLYETIADTGALGAPDDTVPSYDETVMDEPLSAYSSNNQLTAVEQSPVVPF